MALVSGVAGSKSQNKRARLRELLGRAVPDAHRLLQVLRRLRVQLLAQQDHAQLEAVLREGCMRDPVSSHAGLLWQSLTVLQA